MFNPNNYKDEEENAKRDLINLAGPAASENNMPAPNYKVQGPIADHTQEPSAMQQAATTAGANVLGKAGEAALFGVPASASGTGAISGLWGSLAAKGAAAGGGMAGAGAIASAAMPWAIPAIMGAKMFGLFNKGGEVGPLGAQYKEGGGDIVSQLSIPREVKLQMLLDQYKDMYESAGLPTDPDTNMRSAMQEKAGSMPSARRRGRTTWSDVWGALGDPLRGSDLLPAYLMGQLPAFKNQMIVTDSERNQGVPFGAQYKEGGNVQHKEHGGMTGPLSNNKSVKMEKKETIEYKN